MKKLLPVAIVGNGGAAMHAISALRQQGYDEDIHLFSDSVWPSYNPMLTSYYIAGKIPLEYCFGFGSDFYKEYRIHLHLGSPVTNIEAEKQLIETKNGECLCYDKCLIATGSAPLIPPITGINSKYVYTLRTIEDAIAIKEAIKRKPRKVLVVGASMIGIKLAELFYDFGIEVILVDMAKHIFPLTAHPDLAQVIQDNLSNLGINMLFGQEIKSIEESNSGVKVYLSNHETEEADLMVVCIGVRPNLKFLDPKKVEIDKGIVVNDYMRSSFPNIYAAGDVAQGTNLFSGKKEVIALWANACYQGRTAGRNIAGGSDVYPGSIPHNITHFMDMVFVGIGYPQSKGKVVKLYKDDGSIKGIFVWGGEKLVGINLWGNYINAGILKQFFLNGLRGDKFSRDYCIRGSNVWNELISTVIKSTNYH